MSSLTNSLSTNSSSSGSGLDVGATVDQLIYTERAPERLLQSQQTALSGQATALREMNSRLESLETTVNSLKDLSGVFAQRVVQSSNEDLVSATADSSAAIGSHTISISQLATVSSQYSDTLNSPDATFTPGNLQFQVGGGAVQTVTLDASHSTIAKAAQYINGLKLGVTASVVTDSVGSRLTLVSGKSGAAGDITVSASPAGLGFHVGVTGKNAELTIDGVPIQSATNEIRGAVPGVALTLNGTTGNSPLTLKIAPDTEKATAAINSLVSAYNSVIGNINANFTYNMTTRSAGTLSGNASLRNLQSTLLSTMSFELEDANSYTTLRSLGIEMKDDGTLSVDASSLSTALKTGPDAVQKFFQGSSGDGFAVAFSTQLMTLTDSVDGPLLVDAKGLDNSVKSISDQIEQFEVRIEMRQQVLTSQYTKIDALLRQLPLLQQQISAQLGSLK